MEYGPYLTGPSNTENQPEKLILMQSIPPKSSLPSPETEQTKSAAPLLHSTLSSIMAEQLPKPSLLRAANETTADKKHNATLSARHNATTINEQSKSIFDRFQDFSKRFAKLVFKPSKLGNKLSS